MAAADPTRVRCVQAAAADKNGVATLYLDEENLGDHRTWNPGRGNTRSIRVPAVRLDDLIDGELQIHAIKIDTQGTDHLVVRGAERLVARWRPVLFVEFWPSGIEGSGASPAQVLEYYESLGFTIALIGRESQPGDAFDSVEAVLSHTLSTRDGYVDLLLTPK
jgi:hypothetical protein